MPKTKTLTTRTRSSVSISVYGDRDPKVISFIRGSYGIPRLPVKIMDAVNAFFWVFAVNSKNDRQDTEVIEAAQESVTILEVQVLAILRKLESEGLDTSWYSPINFATCSDSGSNIVQSVIGQNDLRPRKNTLSIAEPLYLSDRATKLSSLNEEENEIVDDESDNGCSSGRDDGFTVDIT
jgi:hypothetical protein